MDRTRNTSAHGTRIGRVTNLLLLFIRTAGDLDAVCQQAGEFLGFCRSRQSDSFADGRLLGAWIDEHAVTVPPRNMELRLPANEVIMLAVLETFSLCDVWTVASIQPVRSGTKAGTTLSHNMVFDALFAVTHGDTETGGRYSPAFTLDTPKKHIHAEIKRLNTRYPLRIERPIYYDPVTSRLSLDEE
ncbi:MAG: hypothetical protein ACYDAZ_08830 [Thermoplasmataceae archaeon]